MADETQFKDEVARSAAEAIKTAVEKRDSLLLSVSELNKVIGGQKAFSGFNADSIMALYQKYKPVLIKAGLFAGGGAGFSFLPKITGLLKGLLGG